MEILYLGLLSHWGGGIITKKIGHFSLTICSIWTQKVHQKFQKKIDFWKSAQTFHISLGEGDSDLFWKNTKLNLYFFGNVPYPWTPRSCHHLIDWSPPKLCPSILHKLGWAVNLFPLRGSTASRHKSLHQWQSLIVSWIAPSNRVTSLSRTWVKSAKFNSFLNSPLQQSYFTVKDMSEIS